METKELVETYKEGLRTLADYLESYRKSKLTKPSKLGEMTRALVAAASKKYAKLDYDGLVVVMRDVDKTLTRIYGEDHPCGPLMIFPDDPELTVKNEADRLSRQFVGLGVRELFYRFDAEKVRYAYRQLTSVTDPQAVFVKNLGHVAAVLNQSMASAAFRTMASDLLVAIRDVQGSAFKKSSDPYYSNMVLAFEGGTGLAQALIYRKKIAKYQEMVHEMLKYSGIVPKGGGEFSMDLREYNVWLEDELHNLEELYLCITYQRILNVL